MATAFSIWGDKENNCNQTKKFEKNDNRACENENINRAKLAALTNIQQNDENASEKQTFKNEKQKYGTSGVFQEKSLNILTENVALGPSKVGFSIALDTSVTDLSYCGGSSNNLRNPLQEIQQNDSIIATPMSVQNASPMSVDKSVMSITNDDFNKDISIKSLRRQPKNDRDRFFEVVEYQPDIVAYLKTIENNFRPRPGYMRKQPDINDSMRSILVDWLVEVSEEYKLNGETLSLAINYIDRFLSFMSVVRAKLQLVGTAAILIAAKYEEIYPPEIGEFVYITDDTYTKVQVLRMEKLLLKVLSFDLSGPTHFSFTNLFCIMLDYPDQIKYMAQYLCELSMLNAQPYLEYKPSEISVASISLSLYTFKQKLWNHKLTGITGYTLEELKEIIVYLNDVHNQASTLQQQAIQEKFKSSKYLQTSLVTPKRLTIEMIDEILGSEGLDELNTTAENIETVRQKTSSLLF